MGKDAKVNRPLFDQMTKAEITEFAKFVNLDLRKTMARQMPEEMREMKDKDIVEIRKCHQ